MITSIEIENFRGIRSGALARLGALTILTGPNGCGKSSVLDALLVGASPHPGDAVGRACKRHPEAVDGSRWLFSDRNRPASLRLSASGSQESFERRLIWTESPNLGPEIAKLAERRSSEPFRQVTCLDAIGAATAETFLAFDNTYFSRSEKGGPQATIFVRLIDPSIPVPLDESYSEIYRQGRQQEILDLMQAVVPDLDSLNILTESNREPRLYLTKRQGAIPVTLSGDGIHALVQTLVELALIPQGGLALIEEPEAFLHRRGIFQCARALVEGMRQGRQIVLTTHSLELIDAVLGICTAQDDEGLALFNLRLAGGWLESARWSGEEMRFARNQIEEDLR